MSRKTRRRLAKIERRLAALEQAQSSGMLAAPTPAPADVSGEPLDALALMRQASEDFAAPSDGECWNPRHYL